MAPMHGLRPQDTKTILQCLADIEIEKENSEIYNSEITVSQSSSLFRKNSKGLPGKIKPKTIVNRKVKAKISSNKSRIKLINNLIVGLTMLLLAGATSYLYVVWRLEKFSTNPVFVFQCLISSPFLEKTLNSHFGEVNAIALTPDGKTLVSGGLKTIKIWNLETGEVKNNIGDAHKIK